MEVHLKKATLDDLIAELPVQVISRTRDSDLNEITLQLQSDLTLAQQDAVKDKLAAYGYTVSIR